MELQYKHRYIRLAGWLMMIVFLIPTFMVPYGVLSSGGQWWVIIPGMLVFLLGSVVTGLPLLLRYPKLELTQSGVYAKWLVRTRFVRWEDIQQVGALLSAERYQCKELALLRPGGVKQTYGDTLFRVRNLCRIIYVPYEEKTVEFVEQYYGPLDFDETDGYRKEKS